jgi:hypothetical protein
VTGRRPEICISVRKTLDWGDEAKVRAGLIPGFLPKYEMWNETFVLPYHVFRQRLKAIAEATLRGVAGARLVEPEALPTGALVVPVDDDDWFAPDLAARLGEAWDGSARGYRWSSFILEARPGGLLGLLGLRGPSAPEPDRSRFTCTSNNYAFVAEADAADLVRSHAEASRRFDASPGELRRLPLSLSLQNRNLASQTALGWKKPTISRARLLRRYRRYRDFYGRVALPEELSWARAPVAAMAELMRALRPR